MSGLKNLTAGGAAAALLLASGSVFGGPDRVKLPASYATAFVLYNTIDRPKNKDVRFFYANPEAVEATTAGKPAPDGTILIMETRKAKLDAGGAPLLDANGRMMAEDKMSGVAVQEKRAGWGDALPAETRNGDWDYAMFDAKGALRTDAKYAGCFACHASRAERDYNFTFNKWVLDGKP